MVAAPDQPDRAYELVADRDARLLAATAAEQAALARRARRLPARLALASLLVHACALFALLRLERPPDRIEPSREIPVEVVIEPPPPKEDAARPASEKPSPPPPEKSDFERNAGKPERPEPEPEPKRSLAPKPGEKSVDAAAKKTAPSEPPNARKNAARRSAAADKRPAEPAPRAAAENKAANNKEGEPWRTGGELALPFDLGPEIFRAVATPLPVEGGDDPLNYKVIVFGMLERAKHFPEAALARRAHGMSVIGFALDEAGQVARVALLQSSGDADLDAESLAVVGRAAPFPTPPPGAQRSFVAEITFAPRQ
jgi:colicin import membrane protein